MNENGSGTSVGANGVEKSCAVVVLGAGRSGTSLVTRAVHAIGVDLGDRLRKGSGKNPTGFFEDRDLLEQMQRLKSLLGVRGHSVRLIDPEEWSRPEVEALKAETAELIRRRFGGKPLWGFKHGRTIRFLPFWEDVFRRLDLDVRYVLALRNVLSVARSRGKMNPRRGTQEKSDLEWLVNVVPYFREAAKHPLTVLDYDRLLADAPAELRRVRGELDLPVGPGSDETICAFAEGFIRKDMRHTHFSLDDVIRGRGVHPLVRDAYRWLDLMAAGDVDARDRTFLQDWARIERGVEELRPVLRHVDQVETDLQAARFHLAGPLQSIPQLWRDWRSI